jgi:hypothetical protein
MPSRIRANSRFAKIKGPLGGPLLIDTRRVALVYGIDGDRATGTEHGAEVAELGGGGFGRQAGRSVTAEWSGSGGARG